jgi:hypothetical protein
MVRHPSPLQLSLTEEIVPLVEPEDDQAGELLQTVVDEAGRLDVVDEHTEDERPPFVDDSPESAGGQAAEHEGAAPGATEAGVGELLDDHFDEPWVAVAAEPPRPSASRSRNGAALRVRSWPRALVIVILAVALAAVVLVASWANDEPWPRGHPLARHAERGSATPKRRASDHRDRQDHSAPADATRRGGHDRRRHRRRHHHRRARRRHHERRHHRRAISSARTSDSSTPAASAAPASSRTPVAPPAPAAPTGGGGNQGGSGSSPRASRQSGGSSGSSSSGGGAESDPTFEAGF